MIPWNEFLASLIPYGKKNNKNTLQSYGSSWIHYSFERANERPIDRLNEWKRFGCSIFVLFFDFFFAIHSPLTFTFFSALFLSLFRSSTQNLCTHHWYLNTVLLLSNNHATIQTKASAQEVIWMNFSTFILNKHYAVMDGFKQYYSFNCVLFGFLSASNSSSFGSMIIPILPYLKSVQFVLHLYFVWRGHFKRLLNLMKCTKTSPLPIEYETKMVRSNR